MSRYLIVGLGNPGAKYARTRHNIGFMALERLADRYAIGLSTQKFDGIYGMGRVADQDVVLLEPQTYMNRSGGSVLGVARFYKVSPENILVLHDEIDLDLGKLRLKDGGGHGGHNGLRDIASRMSTRDFKRVRLGIGRPEHGDVSDFVLGRFTGAEAPDVDDLIERACDATELFLAEGLQAAQNRFH
ncbi:peptidyl-tRNA hydrolase [Bradymonas sediminis]|uniref:Peptidyl-tRNA hydrolase n=2 Tax=Bradymonas sediminis TaxID=1548548 RepID=A0A2Z4FMK8_9DELT|nr:aminoacyl-tRNA hydrolase [Bradymonas sediminis]AWV89924.1 aminoacyl-tRNA hydrolase [Bradymonas sediminis]TDP62146.1 peptidyl-tRNA hydrolase [Bradymonas sediminis]